MIVSGIKALVFDLDDTLYPEREYAYSGFAAVAAAFEGRFGDRAETTTALKRLFDTQQRPRVFNAFLTERGLPENRQLADRMVETYRTHRPAIALHADADAVLTGLRGRYALGLITDGPAVTQWAKIDALNLRPRFDHVVVTSELGPEYGKPHPAAFELIARRFNVEPTQCAYVGDNPAKDFIAANALGWTTIQITRPDGIYIAASPAKSGVPHHVIDTLHKLEVVLDEAGLRPT